METSSIESSILNYEGSGPWTIVYTPNVMEYPAAGSDVSFGVQIKDKTGKTLGSTTITRQTVEYIATLTLTGGTLTKIYDGAADFTDCVVQNPT